MNHGGHSRRGAAAVVPALLLGAACGAGDPTGANPAPPGGGGTGFAAEVQTIFTNNCAFATGCHAGTSPQQGMNLSAGRAYGNTVGVPSVEVPRLQRISPGNPDSSYLVLKIEGRAGLVGGVGTRMPLGGQLTVAQIAAIRSWVSAGAAND